MEILVLHPGALGDIVLSLPALDALRRSCRDPKLTLAGNLDYLPFCAWGRADRVLSLSTVPLHRLFSGEPLLPRDAGWWRAFDRIVSWTGSGDPAFAAAAAPLNAAFKIGRWRPRPSETIHVARLFLDSLMPWVPPQPQILPPSITLPGEAVSGGREWLASRGWDGSTPLLAVHPGASSPEKRWPTDRFEGVVSSMARSAPLLPLIIEGPAEPGLGAGLARRLEAVHALLAERPPLDLLTAILSHCRGYLGNDSGISHLAAALGIPVVAVFGPTPPCQWAPLGAKVTVLCDRTTCLACRLGQTRGHVCLANIPEPVVFRALAEVTALG